MSKMDSFQEIMSKMRKAGLSDDSMGLLYSFMTIYTESQQSYPEFYEKFSDIDFVRVVLTQKDFGRVSGKTYSVADLLLLKLYSYREESRLRCILTAADVATSPLPPLQYKGESFETFSLCWFQDVADFTKLKSHVEVLEISEDDCMMFYRTNTSHETLRIAVLSGDKVFSGNVMATVDDDFGSTNYFG